MKPPVLLDALALSKSVESQCRTTGGDEPGPDGEAQAD